MKKDFRELDSAILTQVGNMPASTLELASHLQELAASVSPLANCYSDRFKAERVIESRTQALRKKGKIRAERRGTFSVWVLV